jgi:hypothetical protein
MHLRIERKYGLGHIEDELLGSAYMDEDGGIEITYKHSAMGAKDGATAILYGGPWAVGFNLPTNQNIDTILYRSTWGGGVIIIEDKPPYNKIFWGHLNEKDSFITGLVQPTEKKILSFRKALPILNVIYDTIPLNYDPISGRVFGRPKLSQIKLSGDPFTDTLRIEY